MVQGVGNAILIPPRSGGSEPSAAPGRERTQGSTGFSDGLAPDRAAQNERQGRPAALGNFPFLRRQTDHGRVGQQGQPADIPPHLERRRAWRDARGLPAFHAQSLAQNETIEGATSKQSAATLAYRHAGRRGRVDAELAQRFSLTV